MEKKPSTLLILFVFMKYFEANKEDIIEIIVSLSKKIELREDLKRMLNRKIENIRIEAIFEKSFPYASGTSLETAEITKEEGNLLNEFMEKGMDLNFIVWKIPIRHPKNLGQNARDALQKVFAYILKGIEKHLTECKEYNSLYMPLAVRIMDLSYDWNLCKELKDESIFGKEKFWSYSAQLLFEGSEESNNVIPKYIGYPRVASLYTFMINFKANDNDVKKILLPLINKYDDWESNTQKQLYINSVNNYKKK